MFGLLAIVWEVCVIVSPREIWDIQNQIKVQKGKQTRTESILMSLMGLYFLWDVFGIFSSQGPLFILIMIAGILSASLRRVPLIGIVIVWLNGVISLSLLLAIGVNKFYLHYDLWDKIFSYIR